MADKNGHMVANLQGMSSRFFATYLQCSCCLTLRFTCRPRMASNLNARRIHENHAIGRSGASGCSARRWIYHAALQCMAVRFILLLKGKHPQAVSLRVRLGLRCSTHCDAPTRKTSQAQRPTCAPLASLTFDLYWN